MKLSKKIALGIMKKIVKKSVLAPAVTVTVTPEPVPAPPSYIDRYVRDRRHTVCRKTLKKHNYYLGRGY